MEKDEAFEKVLVTLLVNDEEKQVEVKFNYDIEGLIKTIITSDINY